MRGGGNPLLHPSDHQLDLMRVKFDRKWEAVPESGCWIWTGQVAHGYGRITINGWAMGRRAVTHFRAHRIAWEMYRGPVPEGMDVLHRCDVPLCVNPDHLFIGDQCDNNRDAARKRRSRTARPTNRLSEWERGELVRRYLGGECGASRLAQEYGISRPHVYKLAKVERGEYTNTKG